MLGEWQGERGEIVTRIGVVTAPDEGVNLLLSDGTKRALTSSGWNHFQTEGAR